MQQMLNSVPGRARTSSGPKLNTRDADPDIAKMIQEDMRSLKNRDAGIRERLRNAYHMTEREMTSVSVDMRSGFVQDAFDSLLKAWRERPVPVH